MSQTAKNIAQPPAAGFPGPGNAQAGAPAPQPGEIAELAAVPWAVVFGVSLGSLRRRRLRSFVAMLSVILAIAFLSYMLANHQMIRALRNADDENVKWLLTQAGVDTIAKAGADMRMYILIGLALLTCLVGIMNAMLMSVTERVREIGTLKCIGALDSFIVRTFIVESLLQGVAGTVIGILLGFLVSFTLSLVNYKLYALTHCPWLGMLKAAGAALLIGSCLSMLAAIAPAYWAARKQPVEALRVEE